MPRRPEPAFVLSNPCQLLLWLSLLLTGCVLGTAPNLEDGAASSPATKPTAESGVRGLDNKIAVLLPERGDFARAAQAVRDGILAAHRAAGQVDRSRLRFYDSSDAQKASDVLREAAADGAKTIIGPLQRQAVERLAGETKLPAVTLTLNHTTSGEIPPPSLFQFSLAPEDEAREVARHARAKGYRSTLIIYPDTAWGLRIARAFREAWEGVGGVVEAGHSYRPEAYDLSEALDKLLQTAEYGSGAREGGTMADFVFLVGTSQQVRDIWPQIRQRGGGRLPVFTTSHVTDGHSDSMWISEVAGLYFVDMPWMIAPLRGETPAVTRVRTGSRRLEHDYQRLFAMGVDAYRLVSLIGKAPTGTKHVLQGQTGALWIDAERRVRRELVLSRIGGADHR